MMTKCSFLGEQSLSQIISDVYLSMFHALERCSPQGFP